MKTFEEYIGEGVTSHTILTRRRAGILHMEISEDETPHKILKFIVQGNLLIPETVSENGPPV